MKRPAIFFDRDNTLIVSDGYLGDPSKVTLVEGAADAVARARQYGFAVVTISNQSGVARGIFDEAAVAAVNGRMDTLLAEVNPAALVELHEFCPFHPEAPLAQYRVDSELRKPRPGMILDAAERLDLDLSRSWVIGDAPRDIEAGKSAGCRTILFTDTKLPPSVATEQASVARPDFEANSLQEAMDVIAHAAFAQPRPVMALDSSIKPAVSAVAVEAVQPSATPEAAAKPAEVVPPALAADVQTTSNSGTLPATAAPASSASTVSSPSPIGAPAAMPPETSPSSPSSAPVLPPQVIVPPPMSLDRLEHLAGQILMEMRRQKEDPPPDFSVSKLMAGIVQVLALAVLFVAYLYRADPSLQTTLLFAIALQLLTIALLIMGRQR